MAYTTTATTLPDVLILEPQVFSDERGFFFESFSVRDFNRATLLEREFVQDNHSRSAKGVLRGMHYQVTYPQGKLVRAVQGEIFDVAVDLRRDSATLGKWFGTTLTAENKRQLWVPEGFAHGFLVLSASAEVLYKTTEYWRPEHERSLLWNDAAIGIEWPNTEMPLLAPKDATAKGLENAELY